ncbi:MAG: NDP-sugar synthase [Flavobacteriaceae bacterium]
MVLLIMAAGSGSRYGKLKQFDELGPSGEFLMEFSIYDAIQNGFNHLVLITRKENKDFLFNYLRQKIDSSIKIDVVIQETTNLPNGMTADPKREKPWGTAHAVWCAKDFISDDFAIINADDYYGSNAFKNAAKFFNSSNDQNNYGLVSYKLKDTLSDFGSVSRGVCKVSNDKLISINEHLKIERKDGIIKDFDSGNILDEDDYVSMNFWLCRSNFFNYLDSYVEKTMNELENIEKDEIYLPFAAQKLLEDNLISIDVVDSNSGWFGVTYAQDKKESVNNLKDYSDSIYPTPLWKD